MDNLTPAQRKKNMQHIRSDNTAIEILLRRALWNRDIDIRKIVRNFQENQTLS